MAYDSQKKTLRYEQINMVFMTYSDEFLVFGIVAVLSQDTEESLFSVEGLADFVQTFHKTYNHKRLRMMNENGNERG
jgi:hypothetical protein